MLNGGQGGDRTAALCAMVGCATQAQWRQHPVDCTEFGKVYPPDALQEKAGRTVQPALAEDVVDREFTLFAEGTTTLQKDEHGLAAKYLKTMKADLEVEIKITEISREANVKTKQKILEIINLKPTISNKDIAQVLGVTIRTVERHRNNFDN